MSSIFLIFIFSFSSCVKNIYVGDRITLQGEVIRKPECVEIISKDIDSTIVIPLEAGEHKLLMSNDVEITLKVKTLLYGDIDRKFENLITPKIYRNYRYLAISIFIFIILAISFLIYLKRSRSRDFLLELENYRSKELTKKDLFDITSIVRDYLDIKYDIKKGFQISKIFEITKSEKLKLFFEKIDNIKFSSNGEISKDILDIGVRYISEDISNTKDREDVQELSEEYLDLKSDISKDIDRG